MKRDKTTGATAGLAGPLGPINVGYTAYTAHVDVLYDDDTPRAVAREYVDLIAAAPAMREALDKVALAWTAYRRARTPAERMGAFEQMQSALALGEVAGAHARGGKGKTCIADGCNNPVPHNQGSDYCAPCLREDQRGGKE